tara:strand:- start:1381 stop:1947 length:567 start_codon:yes stop_codon:yes gene_type:complete
MSTISRVMPKKFTASIRAGSRQMKKRMIATKKKEISKRKFLKTQDRLQKAITKIQKKAEKEAKKEANLVLKAERVRKAELKRIEKALKPTKAYKPRRSKLEIEAAKLEKMKIATEKATENALKKASKKAEKEASRKYARRRSKAEIQIAIMEKEMNRQLKFYATFQEKFTLDDDSIKVIMDTISSKNN